MHGTLKHIATRAFWQTFRQLPSDIQKAARESFALMKMNPQHPSLHFKKTGLVWSARITRDYRALADRQDDEIALFWIGPHDEYQRNIRKR